MVKHGDTVFVDAPNYCNLILMLHRADVNVVAIPPTSSGIDTEKLENLARTHKPVLYFTTSVLHNPTGTYYTPACAMRVLQATERHRFWVVEDD